MQCLMKLIDINKDNNSEDDIILEFNYNTDIILQNINIDNLQSIQLNDNSVMNEELYTNTTMNEINDISVREEKNEDDFFKKLKLFY